MKQLTVKLSRLALGLGVTLSLGCDRSATVPNTVSVAGTWSGTESDRLGPALLTWTLTQTGNTVSGTAIMRPVDATDGSCASCHKSKDGTFTGTLEKTDSTLAGTYSGGDPCEGTFEGTLALTRRP